MKITELPQPYAKWVEGVLGAPIPKENISDCTQCPMCNAENKESPRDEFYFNPAIKCCTYVPELPNFLVGAILADESPISKNGRTTVLQRIGEGIGLTPLGIAPPADFTLLYQHSPAAFGRASSLSCPHYLLDVGQCGIWQHRPPPCIMWHCKHERGAIGRDFWRDLYAFFFTVQRDLALWCVQQLDIGATSLRSLFENNAHDESEKPIDANTLDRLADNHRQKKLWGSWYLREEEFFRQCYRLENELDWKTILELCGPEINLRAQTLSMAFAQLNQRTIPDRLRVGEFSVLGIADNGVKLSTYSPFDPLLMSPDILSALQLFEGRSVAEALELISRRKISGISSSSLFKLIDFGVLRDDSSR